MFDFGPIIVLVQVASDLHCFLLLLGKNFSAKFFLGLVAAAAAAFRRRRCRRAGEIKQHHTRKLYFDILH
jgi:hypothetical protein